MNVVQSATTTPLGGGRAALRLVVEPEWVNRPLKHQKQWYLPLNLSLIAIFGGVRGPRHSNADGDLEYQLPGREDGKLHSYGDINTEQLNRHLAELPNSAFVGCRIDPTNPFRFFVSLRIPFSGTVAQALEGIEGVAQASPAYDPANNFGGRVMALFVPDTDTGIRHEQLRLALSYAH